MKGLFYIMGKSASGKDRLFCTLQSRLPDFHRVVLYTTRPARCGETDGSEYHFINEAELARLAAAGRVIEKRCYQTCYGPWYYATVDDGQFDADAFYLAIGTPASCLQLRRHFGCDRVHPIYLTVDDGERLIRAVRREQAEATPKYDEICRRFLADEADFSPEALAACGVERAYVNDDFAACTEAVCADIDAMRR
ncbi:MAG: guanylate kinase [Eubacteriales bacterium]|nr:guanylate kinase [Eubacteriales bacterium]